jgi:hypothetical protein
MKFVIVDPKKRSVETVDLGDLHSALIEAGLSPGEVDHGSLSRRMGYVVYQFGMYVPVAEQSYCAIARRLIAGAAVLYGVGDEGETVDLMKSAVPDVTFFLGRNDVEAAIERGDILRPALRVNGETLWQWPQKAPPGMMP